MKRMKRCLGIVLPVLLVLSLLGCGQKPEPSAVSNQIPAAGQTVPPAEPIPQEPVKLTIGIPSNYQLADYETNEFTLWLERQTGYELEFVCFQSTLHIDYKPRVEFQVPTSAEGLPDILLGQYIDRAYLPQLSVNGVLLDLSSYYADKTGASKVFWERLAQLPQDEQNCILRAITAENGGMYTVPTVEYSPYNNFEYQVFINQTWLDKLELEMPTDPESLRTVLEAFRDGDPNGNGKQDELPIIGSIRADSCDVVTWIINMFTPYDPNSGFQVDAQGQLYLPQLTEEYRQALIYIRGLIKDGLMFPSAFSMSIKEIASIMESQPGWVGVFAGDPEKLFQEGNAAIFEYEALPYWGSIVRTNAVVETGAYITGNCENPDAAWNLLMTMCSEEGSLRMRYGVEGTDWETADGVSYVGTDLTIRVLNEKAFPRKNSTDETNSTWADLYATVFIEPATWLQHEEGRDPWSEKLVQLKTASYFCLIDEEAKQASRGDAHPPRIYCPKEGYAGLECRGVIQSAMKEFCCGTGTFYDPETEELWLGYLDAVGSYGRSVWKRTLSEAYYSQYPNGTP